MLVLLTACTASEPRHHVPPPDPTTTTTTTTTTTGDTGTTLPPEVPGIAEALADACDTSTTTPPPDPPDAGDLTQITFPGTRCNDGSPAVGWARAGAADARDLLVFLEGGGWCDSQASCAERWCLARTSMTSADVDEHRGRKGIFDDVTWNSFAPWHVLFVKYCTSDLWVGSNEAVVLEGDPAWPPFRIDFLGHEVLSGVLSALEAGAVSDDGTVTLPPLRDLDRLVLTGSSAGAHGVIHALDATAERLDVEVVALLDGGFYPDSSLLAPEVATAFQDELRAQWDRAFVPYGAVVDEGCMAQWAATDPWRCADLYEVLRHQLDTPYFLGIDHLNPATVDDFVALGSTTEEFASASAASVQQLIDGVPAMSARATACEEHAILTEGPPFFVETVTDASGTAWTLHDAAVAWLAGESVAANGAPDGSTSDCLGSGVAR